MAFLPVLLPARFVMPGKSYSLLGLCFLICVRGWPRSGIVNAPFACRTSPKGSTFNKHLLPSDSVGWQFGLHSAGL